MKRNFILMLFAIMASIGMLQAKVLTGKCGTNLTYSLNTETGVLTITGSGAMEDGALWYDYRSSIKTIQLPEGLTTIGQEAFYECTSLTSVTIPNSVTEIGSMAFHNCSKLTSVTIPNSVTTIGESAFSRCSSLTSVTIPNSVTTIGNYAFYDCSSLTSITIPNSVTTIGYEAFSWCSSLTSITIPNSVTTIGNAAFSGCSSLTSVTIPNSVTTIEDEVFNDCSSLTSVTIPNSVKTIGERAFSGCSSLTSITIPNSVTWIREYAFYGCTSLTFIGVASDNPYYCSVDGVLFNKNKTILEQYPAGKSGTFYSIPNSVTTIGNYAFYGCNKLTFVTIPNSVTTIGNYAFYGCNKLTSVTIPNSVTTIGSYAFDGCNKLTSVTISNSVTTIGHGAFGGCSSLTSITIPNSVTTIGNAAFYSCSSLTSVNIGNSVTTIGDEAFLSCSSLTSVTIPNSVTTIGDRAFAGCSKLTSITCEATTPPPTVYSAFDGVPKDKAVLYVPFISVEYYKKATGWKYFKNIRFLTFTGTCGDNLQFSLNPEDLVLRITGSGAMYDYESGKAPWYGACSYIKSIELPAGLTTIGKTAFEGFSSLTSVTIPNSVTTIGDYAFAGCSNLTSVAIPNSVKTIGAYAFSGCTELIEINCEAITPPTIKATTFEGVSKDYAVLHVPSNNINLYRQAGGWKEFYDIRPIEANTQSGANVVVPTVTENGATVEWKYVADANTYTLEIKQNGKVLITLVFNESGQLLSINFNTSASAPARKAPALPKFANGTTNGWQYTINGLEPNTTYTYTVTAKKDEKVLETKSIEFTTKKVTTDVENILDGSVNSAKKIYHNGQIYILTPDGKKYTPTGAAL